MSVSLQISGDLRALANLERHTLASTKELAKQVGKLVYDEARAVTGRRFYSLPALRRMGFPYSRRFPQDFLMDDRLINMQSGRLHHGIRWSFRDGKKVQTATIWAGAPHAVALVTGSDKMRPRNFMELAYERAEARMNAAQKRFLDDLEKQ